MKRVYIAAVMVVFTAACVMFALKRPIRETSGTEPYESIQTMAGTTNQPVFKKDRWYGHPSSTNRLARKTSTAVSPDTNKAQVEQPAQEQLAKMLSAVKSPAELVEYLRETGDFEGASKKMAEFIKAGKIDPDEIARMLRPEDSEDVVFLVTMSLADIGTEKAVGNLLKIFDSMPENSDIKRDVGEIIITVKNPASKKLLIETMISSPDQDKSDIAQRTLANMANKEIIVSLLDGYLGSEKAGQKQLFADTVRHMRNPDVVPALAYIVEGENKNASFDMIGEAAADTLAVIGTREATECLMKNAGSAPSETTAANLYSALSRISNPDSLDILVESARSTTTAPRMRVASIQALKNFDYSQVSNVLQSIINTAQDQQIRDTATRSLATAEKYRSR